MPAPKRSQPEPRVPSHDLNLNPPDYQLALKDLALSSAVEGITISDLRLPDNPLVYVNRGFTEITGYSREESIGRNCRYLQGPDTDPEATAKIRNAIAERSSCVVEILNYRHDGETFWNRLSLTPLRDASGEATHYVGVQTDVTRQRSAEETLRETKARLQQAHDRMQSNLRAAASIQRSLLPQKAPYHEGVSFAWHLEPCEELAGDTLNIFALDEDNIGLYVLDVSGHGVQAALLSVTLHRWLSPDPDRSVLRTLSPESPGRPAQIISPDLVAQQLNAQFPMDPATGQYFTLIYGILNLARREFRYVRAGHPLPIYAPVGGEPRQLPAGGVPIGIMPSAKYEVELLTLAPGDRLYLFSDGLTESENNDGEFYDVRRLLEAIASDPSQDLDAALQSAVRDALRWRNHRSPEDDLTLLGVEIS